MLKLPTTRFWNITLRSVHIATMAVLVGGLVFDVRFERLMGWLYATIGSGLVLVAIEAWPELKWFREGRALLVAVKLGLLCLIPFYWNQRIWILLLAIAIASVGSHMPGRFRYYSLLGPRDKPDPPGDE